MLPIGTISPAELRVRRRAMSSVPSRNWPSACAITCHVRPKRLKSFTYAEPRYTCSVSNSSVSGTPCAFAFTRSTSASSCGTFAW